MFDEQEAQEKQQERKQMLILRQSDDGIRFLFRIWAAKESSRAFLLVEAEEGDDSEERWELEESDEEPDDADEDVDGKRNGLVRSK